MKMARFLLLLLALLLPVLPVAADTPVLDHFVRLPGVYTPPVDPTCVTDTAVQQPDLPPWPRWILYDNFWSDDPQYTVWLFVDQPPQCYQYTYWGCTTVPLPIFLPGMTIYRTEPAWVQLPLSCPHFIVGGLTLGFDVYVRAVK